jgi:DNA-binding IclR family transcriptional regulator
MNVNALRPTPQDAARSSALISRIHGQFIEMPGLSLTLPQASRLFGLPEATCLRLLIRLIDSGALRVLDGRYALATAGAY